MCTLLFSPISCSIFFPPDRKARATWTNSPRSSWLWPHANASSSGQKFKVFCVLQPSNGGRGHCVIRLRRTIFGTHVQGASELCAVVRAWRKQSRMIHNMFDCGETNVWRKQAHLVLNIDTPSPVGGAASGFLNRLAQTGAAASARPPGRSFACTWP